MLNFTNKGERFFRGYSWCKNNHIYPAFLKAQIIQHIERGCWRGGVIVVLTKYLQSADLNINI